MDLNETQIKNFLKNTLNTVYKDYILETHEDDLIANKFDTVFSRNIYEDRKKYSDDNELRILKRMTPLEIDYLNGYNGMILFPNKINDKFKIVINMNQVNDSKDFIYTYAHELTHICDYSKFMLDNGIKTENELNSSKYYYPIYYWSEFHARYYSFKYSIKYFDIAREIIIDTIEHHHFKAYMDRLEECMADTRNGEVEILTELMYEYGRFIAYKEYGFNAIEQEIFPRDIVIDMFGKAGIEIYYLFENISSYKNFKANFDKISAMFNEINVNFDCFKDRYNGII